MIAGGYTVGRAARMAGVTVRTLHHYESIGLLIPSDRSSADYRIYSEADLDRLTRILYYRELDFSLSDIGNLLGADDRGDEDGVIPIDLAEHLQRQHTLLTERSYRLQRMLAAIEQELEAHMAGTKLTAEEKLEIFGADYDPSWEDEAEQRWGETTAWQQSQQRTRQYSKDDWKRIKADGDAWNEQAVAAFTAGTTADSEQAMDLAEHHRHVVEQHYDCTYAMHRQLADMYVGDPRMTKYYDALAPGLAQWVHDAIHANADRHPDEQGEGFA